MVGNKGKGAEGENDIKTKILCEDHGTCKKISNFYYYKTVFISLISLHLVIPSPFLIVS